MTNSNDNEKNKNMITRMFLNIRGLMNTRRLGRALVAAIIVILILSPRVIDTIPGFTIMSVPAFIFAAFAASLVFTVCFYVILTIIDKIIGLIKPPIMGGVSKTVDLVKSIRMKTTNSVKSAIEWAESRRLVRRQKGKIFHIHITITSDVISAIVVGIIFLAMTRELGMFVIPRIIGFLGEHFISLIEQSLNVLVVAVYVLTIMVVAQAILDWLGKRGYLSNIAVRVFGGILMPMGMTILVCMYLILSGYGELNSFEVIGLVLLFMLRVSRFSWKDEG